jgi:bifunctional polynucleotide phosphatase/kinase
MQIKMFFGYIQKGRKIDISERVTSSGSQLTTMSKKVFFEALPGRGPADQPEASPGEEGEGFVATFGALPENVRHVAAFDLDHTLVKPKSGKKFPEDADDWTYVFDSVKEKVREVAARPSWAVVIVSNQHGTGSEELKNRISAVMQSLKVPVVAIFSTAKDRLRKPDVGSWAVLKRIFGVPMAATFEWSFYVGDAAGRSAVKKPKRTQDFACTDRAFAHNLGITFYTPEEFFLSIEDERIAMDDPLDFKWDGMTPKELKKMVAGSVDRNYPSSLVHARDPNQIEWLAQVYESRDFSRSINVKSYLSEGQTLVVFVGPPGSTKSSTYRKKFERFGCVRISQDELKTKAKCISETRKALAAGKSVVVDNTNPSRENRKQYVDIARELNVQVWAVFFDLPRPLVEHLNLYRSRMTGKPPVPEIAMRTYYSRYEPVGEDEGFGDNRYVVHFEPLFVTQAERETFLLL